MLKHFQRTFHPIPDRLKMVLKKYFLKKLFIEKWRKCFAFLVVVVPLNIFIF